MKRTGELKRTPLKRGKALAKRSRKHAAANDTAKRARDQYLAEHPLCFICVYEVKCLNTARRTINRATEVHHIASRDAKRPSIFERPENWCPICRRPHHDMVTAEPAQTAQLVFDAKRFCTPDEANLPLLIVLRPCWFWNVNE